MCGIVGILDNKKNYVSPQTIKKMAETVRHRGPDGEGCYVNKSIGLGHRKLNIVNDGHQPICNEDESIWITCDGEIYNHDQLRQALKKQGHKFKTESSAETIVHLYEQRGVDCVQDLRGMFAFAIWDNRAHRLFLARDRLGQKPLNYFFNNNRLLFGSEIKSILEDKEVTRRVNVASLHDYLTLGYTPAPKTMFEGIYKLLPGHIMVYEKERIKIERYWDLNYADKERMSLEEYEERILDLLKEAVKIRLVDGLSPCAFLSGGTDSSAIVAIMSQLGRTDIKTFSIGLKEEDFNELGFARKVAQLYGTDHHEYIIGAEDVVKTLPNLVWYYNEPFGDSSCIPTYYVSNMGRKIIKFVLSGDGGDECFGGYERYIGLNLSRYIDKFPQSFYRFSTTFLKTIESKFFMQKRDLQKINRFLDAVSKYRDPVKRYQRWVSYFDEKQKDLLYTETMRSKLTDRDSFDYFTKVFSEGDGKDFMDRILYLEFKTGFPGDSLVKIDIAGMANSLQVRSPFLDPPLLEFSARIPSNLKLKNLTAKYIFKRALIKILPKQLIFRRKMGFGIPVGKWFRNEMKEFIQEILLDNSSLSRGYFKKEAITTLLNEHISGRIDHTFHIWALLNFELWHRKFIDMN